MASTAATAAKSGTTKQTKPAGNLDELQQITQLTKDAIDQHFTLLKTAPDILYIAMAIWGMESGWKIWHKKGSGIMDSSHLSPVNPDKSTLIGPGYYKSDPIKSFVNRPNITPQEKINVQQGFVAHGLSACMGCYHVIGTPNYNSDFLPYKSLVQSMGLAVNPGESITALFPNNELGKMRSIVAGLIILQNKYKIHINSKKSLGYQNPAKAIEMAVGSYVGKAGSRDINGYSPEDRQKDVLYTPSGKLGVLAQIGLTRTGTATTEWNKDMSALARATPPSNTVQNSQTRVASTSNTPQKPIGCTA